MIYITAFGLVAPNAVHEAMHSLPEIAGVASAVLMSAQMLFGAVGGSLAASLYRNASPLAIGAVMSVGGLAAAAVYAGMAAFGRGSLGRAPLDARGF